MINQFMNIGWHSCKKVIIETEVIIGGGRGRGGWDLSGAVRVVGVGGLIENQ